MTSLPLTHLGRLLATGHRGVREEGREVGRAVQAVLEGHELALDLVKDAGLSVDNG